MTDAMSFVLGGESFLRAACCGGPAGSNDVAKRKSTKCDSWVTGVGLTGSRYPQWDSEPQAQDDVKCIEHNG